MKTASTLRLASRSLRFLAVTVAVAAALGASACAPVVSGPGAGGEGGANAGGSGGSTPVAVNAIAVPYVLLSQPMDPGTSTGSSGSSGAGGSGGGGGVDPNTLYVEIGNFSQTCGADDPPYCTTGALAWQISIGIPPALQVPGVLQLSDPSLITVLSENGPYSSTPGDCFGGGGSFSQGTMEIVSIDAGTIVVKLTGTTPFSNDFSTDGVYTAPICPTGV